MADSAGYREPWLRGAVPGVHPVIGALIHSLQHAWEDLRKWTVGLNDEQVWQARGDIAPLGFQIRHIAGSVDRLMTYALGGQLSVNQFADLSREKDPGAPLEELLAGVHAVFVEAESVARRLDPAAFDEPRAIGRSRLATTLGGLLVHVAEHTQRHVGEAIVTAKALKLPLA